MSQIDFAKAYRPPVLATHGMVTSAHPLASSAGLDILKQGGKAFDAAVAVATTLNVVEPYMSGIGGVGILLAFNASKDEVKVLNYSGCAPICATPDVFPGDNVVDGILSIMVPGSVQGWLKLHEEFGTMERKRLFASAIQYAGKGFPLTYFNHKMILNARDKLQKNSTAASVFLPRNGYPPMPGQLLIQQDLANSLQLIADEGMSAFYRGDIAKAIVAKHNKDKGLITTEDLDEYEAIFEDPIDIAYRGYSIFAPGPNSNAFQIFLTLKILERFNFSKSHLEDVRTFHIIAEAVKLATGARIQYSGDPNFSHIPVDDLLLDSHVDSLIEYIKNDQVKNSPGERWTPDFDENQGVFRNAPPNTSSTTHFAVADRWGNIVTVTQTIGDSFGSGVMVPDTGILMNNVASNFSTNPKCTTPNLIGPRKRPETCTMPIQVFNDGRFSMSVGTPGGWGILYTTIQLLMNVLDFDMNIQQAIEAPRFKCTEGKIVELEGRFSQNLRGSLKRLGYDTHIVGDWSLKLGGAQGIKRLNGDVLEGGADPRRDGYVYGW